MAATLILAAGWVSACSGTDTIGSGWGDQGGTKNPGNGDDSGTSSGDDGTDPDSGSTTPPTPGKDSGTTPPTPGKDSGTTPPPPAPDSAAPPPNDGFDQFQHHNLDTVNRYRAMLGVAPLVLDQTLCTFALAGSNELKTDHTPHQHFITAGNNGSLWTSGFMNGAAENQGDPNGWTVLSQDPVQNELLQIDDIQKAMYNEGPGAGEAHGHYTNMMNAAYKRLGVGLVEVNNSLYLTNDFSE